MKIKSKKATCKQSRSKKKCRQNSAEAKLALYKTYYLSVYNSCYRLLRQPENAEDAMHDCFIKAFEHAGEVDESVPLEAWLKRIAINTSIDMLRKKRTAFLLEHEIWLDNEREKSFDEDECLEEKQHKVELIKQGIEALPPSFGMVLSLHLIEGYDYGEIEQILGISASSIRSYYARGKQKLIELIKKKEKEEETKR